MPRYHYLSSAGVLPNGARWSGDGRRIALVTISRPSACAEPGHPGTWQPLWMIGDVRTGLVESASIRPDRGEGELRVPRTGVYSRF